MKKALSLFICCIIFIGCFQTASLAYDGEASQITPYNNNTISTNVSFVISDDGIATIILNYVGYQGTTTGATITTKLQKKFLLFFWQDVDIGTADNVWVDESSDYRYSTSHSIALSKKGTYRVQVEYQIRGTGGATDVITLEKEAEY